VKRDTRTIDEIRMDLQKKREGKVLDGDEAKTFDDWFTTKKKVPVKKVQDHMGSVNHSGTNTPTQRMLCYVSFIITRGVLAQTDDHLDTAPSSSFTTTTKSNVSLSTPLKTAKASFTKAPIPKPSSQPTPVRSLDQHPVPKSQSSRLLKTSAAERERDCHGPSHLSNAIVMQSKKRPRSESRSVSPPPKKRALSAVEKEEKLSENISSAIWSMFGKKRDKYTGMDVFSDDEDMEADADDLEREEMFR